MEGSRWTTLQDGSLLLLLRVLLQGMGHLQHTGHSVIALSPAPWL